MKILRITDRIRIKLNEIEVTVAPLTYSQKMELAACLKITAGETRVDAQKTALLTLSFSIKEISGLEGYDGNPYELQFVDEAKSKLTDECTGEIVAALATTELMGAIHSVLANKLDDMEGVEVEVISKK